MDNTYKNLLTQGMPDININKFNMTNLNFMNPSDQMKNQIITFIKNITNQIKL